MADNKTSSNLPYAILGDSHVSSFLVGARQAGGEHLIVGGGWAAATAYFEPFFDVLDGRISPFEDLVRYGLWKKVSGTDINDCHGRLIISMGLASIPATNMRLWRSVGRNSMSRGLINTIIDDLQVHVVRFYDALIDRGLLAAVYDPPAPSASHPVFKMVPRELIDEVATRYRAPVLERVKKANLPLIRLPVEGPDGFIDPKYAGSDPAHASPAIGPHVVAALKALGATPPHPKPGPAAGRP